MGRHGPLVSLLPQPPHMGVKPEAITSLTKKDVYPAPSVVAAAAEAEAEGSSPGGTGPAGGAKKCKGGEGRSNSAPCTGTTKASCNAGAQTVMEER